MFSQSTAERDFIMHSGEVCQVAAMQVRGGGSGPASLQPHAFDWIPVVL